MVGGSTFVTNHVKTIQERRNRIKSNVNTCRFLMNELYTGVEDARRFLDKQEEVYLCHHPKRLRTISDRLKQPSKDWKGTYWLAESCKGSFAIFPYLFDNAGDEMPQLVIYRDKDNEMGNPMKAVEVQARVRTTWDAILQDLDDSKLFGGHWAKILTDDEKALARQSVALCAPICAMHWLYNHTQEQCYGDPLELPVAREVADPQKLQIKGGGELCKWRTYARLANLCGDSSIYGEAERNIKNIFNVAVPPYNLFFV